MGPSWDAFQASMIDGWKDLYLDKGWSKNKLDWPSGIDIKAPRLRVEELIKTSKENPLVDTVQVSVRWGLVLNCQFTGVVDARRDMGSLGGPHMTCIRLRAT